jgi:ElaA protein
VISVKRRCGLATRILKEGIALAKEKFGAKSLTISSQAYACPVYEKVGFVRTDDEYLEDGIPHVRMTQEIE